ncbi:hypothetical protein Tco_1134584 [Tanacetum coccineum]
METMTEPTMEEYVNKTRGNYYSGIIKTMINRKAAYELKGKFLDDLWNNAFSGTNGEDAVEHTKNFLKIVDPLDFPNVSYEQIRLIVFPISLTGDASAWLMNEPQSSVTTWGDLTKLFLGNATYLTVLGDDQEVLTDEAFSDLEETYDDGEQEIAKIFSIETNLFDLETPLCKAFNKFNYILKINTDFFTSDIPRFKKRYDDLVDGKIKEEALKKKAIYEGSWGSATQ